MSDVGMDNHSLPHGAVLAAEPVQNTAHPGCARFLDKLLLPLSPVLCHCRWGPDYGMLDVLLQQSSDLQLFHGSAALISWEQSESPAWWESTLFCFATHSLSSQGWIDIGG